jgi:GT2 family glycosyltransferase
MARRARDTLSRGSKKRPALALRTDVHGSKESTSQEQALRPLYSDSADDQTSVDVIKDGDREPANAYDGQEGESGQLGINDSTPICESERPASQIEAARPIDAVNDDFIPAESFDEAGYLRLNPDVRRAIELGQLESGYSHYLWHGRAEGRRVPDTPREARNIMLASSHGSLQPAVSTNRARASIDALLVAPKSGLMIIGWIDDVSHPLSCIRIIAEDWRVVIDASRYLRVRRMDVEQAVGGRRLHAFGFIGFLHFDQGGAASRPIKIELWQEGGYSTVLECAPAFVEDVELRDTVLAHLASSSFFGNPGVESMSYLGRGVGAELVRFNKSITRRIVATPYVERFGPQKHSPRGTIVVCLYGKPEFFFVQNCLYAGLPGIDDYEFVYVSNSPEMAETLLREARSANLIYGLTNSVVILSGNAGFGAANNAAARIARSDRLLVVNPDVFPRDRDWALKHTELLATAPRHQTRIFGVPLYYDDGSLMHGGMYFEVDVGLSLSSGTPAQTLICRTEHYGKGAPSKSKQFTTPRPVPSVTGAFISIERSWYEELGGFTEDFIFGHYEDADLCLKSIVKGTAPWLHDIRMWHLEGKGSTRQPPHEGGSIVNRWLFSSTWIPMIEDGLKGPAPTHALMQPPVPPAPAVSDNEQAKRKIGRQRRAI